MAKMLVVGGTGFIGSHIVDELLKAEHDVVVLDNLNKGFKENVNPKADIVIGDITDSDFVSELFRERQFDYVYHLAAQSAIGLSNFIKRFNYTTNVIGSVNLINASVLNDVKCFIFVSSIGVYGFNEPPFEEDKTILSPQDPYSISKYAVEKELESTKRMFDLNYIILDRIMYMGRDKTLETNIET